MSPAALVATLVVAGGNRHPRPDPAKAEGWSAEEYFAEDVVLDGPAGPHRGVELVQRR